MRWDEAKFGPLPEEAENYQLGEDRSDFSDEWNAGYEAARDLADAAIEALVKDNNALLKILYDFCMDCDEHSGLDPNEHPWQVCSVAKSCTFGNHLAACSNFERRRS